MNKLKNGFVETLHCNVSIALILLMLCCFHAPAFADLNTGLVAYWSFDDCSAKDNSGSNIIGTLNNVTCVDGIKSKAFSFNGSNSSITTTLPIVKKTYSVSMFAKFNSNDSVENQLFYLTRNGYADRLGYLSTYPVGSYSWHWGAMDITGNSSHWIERADAINDPKGLLNDKWYHLTFILNDTDIALYVDGVLLKNIKSPYHSDIENSQNLLFWLGATSEGYQHLDGFIDELRIYNRALTAAEVTALYQQGTTPDPNDILGDFIDLNKSTIDFKLNKIAVTFTKPVTALTDPNSPPPSLLGSYFNRVSLVVDSKSLKSWTFDEIKNQLQNNYVLLDLPDLTNYQDKVIQLQFIKRGVSGQLQVVTDKVVNFAPTAILNSRTVDETKPINDIVCSNKQGVKTVCNNFFDSAETGANISKTAVFRNTLTHRLIDFDGIVNRLNAAWFNSAYGKSPQGDNNRIPLLLIHGWQGNSGLRNPAKLGLWENSELQYWRHFLDYYLATPALQSRYHVYLYHYPTYKHITYNASVLSEMLTELATKAPNSDLNVAMQSGKKGVVVLAHSMGGLVTRSAIEEYQAFGATGEKLRRLITLDTPHHGSPGANPSISASFVGKDLYTQGSADLQWDNFNLLYDKAAVDAQNLVRWNLTETKSINSKKFDDAYQIACNTTLCGQVVTTQNPWLAWMNFNYDKATFSKKYLLYAGWIMYSSTDIIDNGSMNISNETLSFSAGIPSGGAEPVNSALWYTSASSFPFILNGRLNETPFYTGCSKKANWDASQWFGGDSSVLNITAMSQTNVCGNPVLISKSATLSTPNPNHPLGFQLRIFWDYDHETMVNGAYWGEGTGLFNTKNAGGWDKYINKGIFLNTGSSSSDTGFLNTKVNSAGDLVRDVYIAKAQGYLFNSESNTFPVKAPSTYNPLKLEPLFMVLQKDLLRTNAEVFIVP